MMKKLIILEYFNDIIKVKDRRPSILNEDTFDDYVENAKGDIRKLDLCSEVISIYSKLKKEEATAAPAPVPTAAPVTQEKSTAEKKAAVKFRKKVKPLKLALVQLYMPLNQLKRPELAREKKPSMRTIFRPISS